MALASQTCHACRAATVAVAMIISVPSAATEPQARPVPKPLIRAGSLDAATAAALASQINALVRPCYVPVAADEDARSIITRLRIRLHPDGSLAAVPEMLNQIGITPSNQALAPQMAQAATLAVQHCAPFKLPADLYDVGWKDFILRFNPRTMN
jgi:hypothetical protein